jgi:hypothetical protein
MLENFDPSTVSGNPVYQCGICENNNELPFAANDRRYWPFSYDGDLHGCHTEN